MIVMSFRNVDAAVDPSKLVARLDVTAVDMAENKARITALAGIGPGDRWLDLGCGTGGDIAGYPHGVGLDTSMTMLREARRRRRASSLVAGDAHRLPFADEAFAGGRIERVLQHVEDPQQVLREVGRCLRTGAQVGIFEPDWSSIRFDDMDVEVSARIVACLVARQRHGEVGRQLPELLASAGFKSIHIEPEEITWSSIEGLRRTFPFHLALDDAERADPVPAEIRRWRSRLHELDARGDMRAYFTRYYAAATAPPTP